MAESRARYWQSLTTVEVAAEVARDPVAILPIGSLEQHGPHLPLSTDLEIGLGLLVRAFEHLDDVPAWLLPPFAVGASEEHTAFPGTLSFLPEHLVEAVVAVGHGLARTGVRRLVLANCHGGNHGAMDIAGLRLRSEHGMLVVKSSYFRLPGPDNPGLPPDELKHGFHGGAFETSLMLHLRPDLVRTDRIGSFRSLGEDLEASMHHLGPEAAAAFSWKASDLNPAGVVGDATLASAEEGARLATHYARAWAEVVMDAHAFPVDRLRDPAEGS